MRIAHVCDTYLPRLGGMELQVAGLAAHQQATGDTVEVVTGSPGPELAGPPVHRVGLRPAVRTVTTGRFDAVHVHVGVGSPLGFTVAAAAARAGIPTVVTVHSLWAYVHPLFRTVDAVAGITRLPIRWTAVSNAAAAPVRRLLPPGTDIAVLPNGVEPAEWASRPAPRLPDTVVVAAVMRLTTRKRTLPLLRILRAARAAVPHPLRLRAIVLGDGPRRPAAERYLRQHAMTSWVTLPGAANRAGVARLLRAADIFVAPADLESFGIAALEARCAGVPVLARASTGVTGFVRHGREGLLSTSDTEMAGQLARLAVDGPLRTAIAEHNRRTPCPIGWPSVLAGAAAAYDDAARLLGAGRALAGAGR